MSKSAAAAATAMAKLSAGTKGVQTHGRELVERLTKLDAAVHQRRAPCQIAGSAPAEPGESNAGHPSVSESAHSPQVDVEQETERITNVIEEMVGQIGSTVCETCDCDSAVTFESFTLCCDSTAYHIQFVAWHFLPIL